MLPLAADRGGGYAPPAHDSQHYTPSARPGCLAPHAWLPDGRSLYDLFGLGFALIVADNASELDIGKIIADADKLGVPLAVVRPEGVDIAALYGAPMTLVRPDQHVAWRGARWSSSDSGGTLARAIGVRDAVMAG